MAFSQFVLIFSVTLTVRMTGHPEDPSGVDSAKSKSQMYAVCPSLFYVHMISLRRRQQISLKLNLLSNRSKIPNAITFIQYNTIQQLDIAPSVDHFSFSLICDALRYRLMLCYMFCFISSRVKHLNRKRCE